MQIANRNQQFLVAIAVVPSLGVLMATYLFLGNIGQFIYLMTRVWLIALSIFWTIKIGKKHSIFSR